MAPRTLLIAALAGLGSAVLVADDWPEWRGPLRNGTSTETNLPSRWSPAGENVAWSLPFGGRSAPVIFGNRLYLQTTTGDLATTQEWLVAVDADSGKVVWDRKVSQYLSDVPQDRVAWASPAVDRATGNIYMFTASAELLAFSPEGKLLWDRSLPEEYGAITTHGGRTTSPIIEDDKVILNTLIQNWGPDLGRPGNRYFAFDKRTGQTIWVSSPQARHWDTNFSTPIVVDVNGSRLFIVGGTDGVFHALQVNTGKPVWSYDVSKRAILNGVLFRDNIVYVNHGQENIDTTEMGMIAAIDATGTGPVTGSGDQVGHARIPAGLRLAGDGPRAPVCRGRQRDSRRVRPRDGQGALDQASRDDPEELARARRRKDLRRHGKREVLHPAADRDGRRGARRGSDRAPRATLRRSSRRRRSPTAGSMSRPIRRTLTSRDRTATSMPSGPRRAQLPRGPSPVAVSPASASKDPVAQVQVFPYEALLDAGGKQAFTLKLFDAKGNFIRTAPASEAQWTLDLLRGHGRSRRHLSSRRRQGRPDSSRRPSAASPARRACA